MNSKLASCFVAAIVTAALFMSGTAAAASFVLPPPDIDVIGATSTVRAREEDTLLDIAREHGLGYEDIVRANPDTDPWLPGEGTEVLLPTRFILPPGPRKGIVLNLPELRLYYYPPAKSGEVPMVETHPISIGRMDWATPLGQTKIVTKVRNPAGVDTKGTCGGRRYSAERGSPGSGQSVGRIRDASLNSRIPHSQYQ